MSEIDNVATFDSVSFEDWLDTLEARVPEDIASAARSGGMKEAHHETKIKLGVRRFPSGDEVTFKAKLTDTLRAVFSAGAELLGVPLLPPPPNEPLDALRYLKHRGDWSEPITDLEQPLWLSLNQGVSRHLGIEYKLVIKINTRWGIAPSTTATPRELLTSFGMNPQEFSLYTVDGVDPLPPDTPLALQRGDCFEAQKDGKYGSSASVSRAARGSQRIEDDIATANESG